MFEACTGVARAEFLKVADTQTGHFACAMKITFRKSVHGSQMDRVQSHNDTLQNGSIPGICKQNEGHMLSGWSLHRRVLGVHLVCWLV